MKFLTIKFEKGSEEELNIFKMEENLRRMHMKRNWKYTET